MLFLVHAAAAQFIQQGNKLVGSDAGGAAQQGTSVALSADGNTAIVGACGDATNLGYVVIGAARVFTRTGGVWSQLGSKLVGTGARGPNAVQGFSVAMSADGTTGIIGGPGDSSSGPGTFGVGAVWVFTRSGGVWSQQGSKLVGTGAIGAAEQGASVAISGDGNTAIVGGPIDNSYAGAAWVFTRSDGVWTQQGNKLVGTGAVPSAQSPYPLVYQGTSVAISADGNTALVGGPGDNSSTGAVWVFTRSGGVWSQQGNKLVGTGVDGFANQGTSLAISADGTTAVVGGYTDNNFAGAAWVFTRSGGVWSQQGSKLVGTGAIGAAEQGASVAISGDGNAAIVGGFGDISFARADAGAAWVFTRTGVVWTQQGNKLVGNDAVGAAKQGTSVAISGDGNTAVAGGPGDNSNVGAAWVFVAAGCTSPSITSQPQSQSIVSGQTVTLAVIATGTQPLSYRWYQGNAGDTSTPVGANASTFTTPPLESTTSYWVWVFNACGTADSATATITVQRRVRRHLRRAM
jgi:hypothetical protein